MNNLPSPLRGHLMGFCAPGEADMLRLLQDGSTRTNPLPDFGAMSVAASAAPPVIFLDVDGVLNRTDDAGEERIDGAMLDRVRRLAESCAAVVVISSDWRTQPDAKACLEQRLARVAVTVIGATPLARTRAFARPAEIFQWLATHPDEHNGRYVVLDDRDLTRETRGAELAAARRFVRTDPHAGLTDENLAEAVGILSRVG